MVHKEITALCALLTSETMQNSFKTAVKHPLCLVSVPPDQEPLHGGLLLVRSSDQDPVHPARCLLPGGAEERPEFWWALAESTEANWLCCFQCFVICRFSSWTCGRLISCTVYIYGRLVDKIKDGGTTTLTLASLDVDIGRCEQ